MHLVFMLEFFLTNSNYLPAVEACRFSEAVGIQQFTVAEIFSLHL